VEYVEEWIRSGIPHCVDERGGVSSGHGGFFFNQYQLVNELACFTAKIELSARDSDGFPLSYEEILVSLSDSDISKANAIKRLRAVDVYKWIYTMEKKTQRYESENEVEDWLNQ